MDTYEVPRIADHGDLLELTAAVQQTGCEDGSSKFVGGFTTDSGVTGICIGILP